tara:strand:+ start:352 stop:555 length:204 start_codon:yes stop_codon:yes gene_type:complete
MITDGICSLVLQEGSDSFYLPLIHTVDDDRRHLPELLSVHIDKINYWYMENKDLDENKKRKSVERTM